MGKQRGGEEQDEERKREGGGQRRQIREKKRKTDRAQTGSMSSCLEGGVIPPSNNVFTSNGVLMRLHGEDKKKIMTLIYWSVVQLLV